MRSNKGFRIRQISYRFHTLSPFSDWSTKKVFDLVAVEEEGQEETAYPKLILSELGF